MTSEETTSRQKEENRNRTKQKDEVIYKFSNKGQDQLMEAVIIENKSTFMKYFCEKDKRYIQVQEKIIDVTPNLRPPRAQEYPNGNPYEFKTTDEPQNYLQRALKETSDTLLRKIKNMVRKYNEIDEKTITLLSADILGSYFQDRFSTVHYLILVGANGTGKSAFGDTYECVGYRAVKVTNTTDAFWFRIFGNIEFGQVTIIAEEFDRMDESSQIMTVLKEGYQPNTRVPRMNSNNDKMEFFNPFGFKIIIGEKSPNENKARGVLDRSFKIKSYKGIPNYNIKEIRNPQGNAKRKELFEEINDLRKLLLMYRLIHIKDPYKEISVGLDGRDEELCKPILQLFYTLGASDHTLNELTSTLQYFLDSKNKRKGQSFEAVIFTIVVNSVSKNGERISSTELWRIITDSLEGQVDEKNSNKFYSSEYGKLYRNSVVQMLCDKFNAEKDHTEKGNDLIFDSTHLNRIGKIYQIQGRLMITPIDYKTDGLTHQTQIGEQDHSDEFVDSNSNRLSNNDESDESVNALKKKCLYCDYEEHPFFLKIHTRNAHPQQG